MSDAWPGEVIHGNEEDFYSAQALSGQASPAPKVQAAPVADQYPGEIQPSTHDPISADAQKQGGFADTLPDQPRSHMAPEDEAQLEQLKRTGTADQITHFMVSKGFQPDPALDLGAWVADRDKRIASGQPIDANTYYNFPKPTELDTGGAGQAFARGAADTGSLGSINKFASAVDALGDKFGGSDHSFGDLYNLHSDVRSAVQQQDETDHPYARIAGQLLGGLAIPSGLEGVGLRAGTETLRAGGTMADARAAAQIAVVRRSSTLGGAAGAAHGVLSADSPEKALTGGLTEGALGALAGGALPVAGAKLEEGASQRAAAAAIPTEAQKFAQAAQNLKVDYLPADKPGALPTQWATSLVNNTLGGIPITEAAQKVVASAAAARDRIASAAGRVADKVGAGEAAQSGANKFISSTADTASKLYEAIPIAAKSPALLSNTRAALADLTSGLDSNKALSGLISDPKLQAFRDAIQGTTNDVGTGILNAGGDQITKKVTSGGQLSWEDLKAFRSYVGEKAGQPALSSDTSQAALKNLYGALSDDMRSTAAADSPRALTAFNRANTFYRARQDRIDNVLSAVLGKNLDKGEQSAFERIQSWSSDQGGDPIRLARLMRSLPPEDASTVRASIIQRLGQAGKGRQDATGDVFSPADFLTHWNAMSPRAKGALFQGDTRNALDDLATVTGGMKASSKFANTSKTGIAVGAASTGGLLVVHPLLGALYIVGQIGAGHLLGNPNIARWLASYAKKPNASAGLAKIQDLSRIARANPAIANEVLQLQQRLAEVFSSAPTRMAAQEPPNEVAEGQGNAGQQQPDQQGLQP
jgi:hypothetical protein